MTRNQNNGYEFSEVAQKWKEALKKEGYEECLCRERNCKKIKNFSRLWRRIFKCTNFSPYERDDLSVFEVGCGGGKHLVQFALNKWRCSGIDCSRGVLKRAQSYINQVSKICGEDLSTELIYGDFLYYKPLSKEKFDIVFQVGVLEHFIELKERMLVIEKMFSLAKPGGYVISVVPSGKHPLRDEMREKRLGGYNIPEIDYSPESLFKEMEQAGGKVISVIGHDIFSYLPVKKNGIFPFRKIIYLAWQIIPISWLPDKFIFRHAGTLIVIAKN